MVLEEKAQQYKVRICSVESLHAVVTCVTVLYRLVLQYKVRVCSVESLHAVVTCLTDCAIQISSAVQGENLLCRVMACCGYMSN